MGFVEGLTGKHLDSSSDLRVTENFRGGLLYSSASSCNISWIINLLVKNKNSIIQFLEFGLILKSKFNFSSMVLCINSQLMKTPVKLAMVSVNQ